MSNLQQSSVRNRVLRALPPEDFAWLAPHLRPVAREIRQVIIAPQAPVTALDFPETGVVSVVAEHGPHRVEVGMIGREGVVGASIVLLGLEESPYEYFVQIPGSALRIAVEDVRAAVAERPALHRILMRAVHVELVQARQTAFANATFVTEVRLARWLLMCRDRVDTDDICVTHEFLSVMLGVQRGGVTLALQNLEGAGHIRSRRGRVTILRRGPLEAVADGAYGMPESQFVRLIEGG